MLKKEKEIDAVVIAGHRQQRILWLVIISLLILSTLCIAYLYRKIRRANDGLKNKNVELTIKSSRDPLTALYNRRHFQDFISGINNTNWDFHEQRVSNNSDIVSALYLLDIDFFKNINDIYGHAAGDAVLKMVADNLRLTLRETDMIVRWGGEEFLVYFPKIARISMDEIASRILDSMGSQIIQFQDCRIQITVSIGFSVFPLVVDEKALSWERSINLVDMALYISKANGRNRAYGVREKTNYGKIEFEAIEKDLEKAWQSGSVELGVVLGTVVPVLDGAIIEKV